MIERSSADPTPAVPENLLRQRRAARRHPLEASVQVVQPAAGAGVTINASRGGLRIAIDLPLSVGTLCVLVVREPGVPEQLVRARVAWSRVLDDDGCIAGLERLGLH